MRQQSSKNQQDGAKGLHLLDSVLREATAKLNFGPVQEGLWLRVVPPQASVLEQFGVVHRLRFGNRRHAVKKTRKGKGNS